jgi:hypothetical protein
MAVSHQQCQPRGMKQTAYRRLGQAVSRIVQKWTAGQPTNRVRYCRGGPCQWHVSKGYEEKWLWDTLFACCHDEAGTDWGPAPCQTG